MLARSSQYLSKGHQLVVCALLVRRDRRRRLMADAEGARSAYERGELRPSGALRLSDGRMIPTIGLRIGRLPPFGNILPAGTKIQNRRALGRPAEGPSHAIDYRWHDGRKHLGQEPAAGA